MSVALSPRLDLHRDVLDELCSGLFTSMFRSDQRRKGMSYLYGLLTAPGRKSMRNIAAAVGGHATEQSLHHFISDSTWDWAPVREALTDYTVRAMPPQAWVVRPMVIPKAGNDSVGVGRRFCPTLGQALNAQHALGVWAASDEVSSPVNWRLHLPHAWLRDERKRSRASIPDGVGEESITDCVLEAYLEVASRPGVPSRPVVLDARCLDIERLARRLRAAGTPWLVRIGTNHRLTTDDVRLPGLTSGAVPAYQLIGALRSARRLLNWTDHEPIPTTRTDLVAAVRVGLPTERGVDEVTDLHLIGTGLVGHPWPAQLWLTDLGDSAAPAELLRLGKLVDRVDRDAVDIGERVGLRDFSGRSFAGWHRHVTLASAAHALCASTDPGARAVVEAPAPRTPGARGRVFGWAARRPETR
ncbi:IS701 family transposase, partial [Saccharothrix hoggarensis]